MYPHTVLTASYQFEVDGCLLLDFNSVSILLSFERSYATLYSTYVDISMSMVCTSNDDNAGNKYRYSDSYCILCSHRHIERHFIFLIEIVLNYFFRNFYFLKILIDNMIKKKLKIGMKKHSIWFFLYVVQY